MKKIIALTLIFALPLPASATKVRDTNLEEMYQESDVVAYGLVEGANVIAKNCGVQYTVRVMNSFKGALVAGAAVLMRSGAPTQVGSNYYLFLSPRADRFTPLLSTNSGHAQLAQEFEQRCSDALPAYEVNAFGNGALKETGTYATGDRGVVLLSSIIVPPDHLKVTKLEEGDRYDCALAGAALDAVELKNYLRTLSDD